MPIIDIRIKFLGLNQAILIRNICTGFGNRISIVTDISSCNASVYVWCFRCSSHIHLATDATGDTYIGQGCHIKLMSLYTQIKMRRVALQRNDPVGKQLLIINGHPTVGNRNGIAIKHNSRIAIA